MLILSLGFFALLRIKRKYIKLDHDGPILECLEHPESAAFLFYPGTMIEPGHYALFINFLYLAGFSVYAMHLNGHGKNIRTKVRSLQHMLEQGLKAQEWILLNKCRTLVVGGHSQGGICALWQGACSDRPAALFPICACLPQMPSAIAVTRFVRFQDRQDKILTILKRAAGIFPRLPVPLPLYLSGHKILANCRHPIITGKGVTRISYPLEFLYSLFSCNIPEQILCPLWLIGSRGDALFTEKIINETYNRLRAPEKKLIYLPEGGHLSILNPWLARYCANICACAAFSINLSLNTEI